MLRILVHALGQTLICKYESSICKLRASAYYKKKDVLLNVKTLVKLFHEVVVCLGHKSNG